MKYGDIYQRLIDSAKYRGLDKKSMLGYYEKHHILPKCLGGDDSTDNLVLLTGREHFIAHKLLCKMYPENKSLFFALYQMSIDPTDREYKVTASGYERLRTKFCLQQTGNSNPAKRPEVRKKMSEARKGRPSSFLGKKFSEESRKKLSEAHIGMHKGELNPCYGLRPWETPRSRVSAASQLSWSKADQAHTLFLKGMSHKSIYKRLDLPGTNPSSFIKMVEHFRMGWVPENDTRWLAFTAEFNPYKDIS